MVYGKDDGVNRILIAFLHLPKMGRKTAFKLLKDAPAPASLEELVSRWKEAAISFSDISRALDYADECLFQSKKNFITTLNWFSADYPKRLRDIDDPPLLFHVKGAVEKLNHVMAAAIIGTREPTGFGRASARKISACASEAGAVVVSGLALGCDTEAHIGCLEAKGTTIAVLAHGLDKVYPADNRELADRILESAGCLVSEYEYGVRPFRTSFVERDRLQSGLSQAVLLIETGIKGGSLHTIGFAIKQRRYIACIAHPKELMNQEKAMGNQKLIEEKIAEPLSSKEDVIFFLKKLAVEAWKEVSAKSCDADPPNERESPGRESAGEVKQLSMF